MNQTAVAVLLQEHLKALNLMHLARHLDVQVRQARDAGVDYLQFLLDLTEVELGIRSDNREKRRLKEAHFPMLKTLETFDFDAAPALDRRLITMLATGTYLTERRNIILLGNSGTGKTHLATALGVEACRQSRRVRFTTGHNLVNDLIEARSEKAVSRLIGKYTRLELLILDELGYVPFSREGAELLFQVLAERHERGSVIITTNLGFADWTQIFGDANMTAALLDRVTHRAHIVECSWGSYRLRQTLTREPPVGITTQPD
jgi:DNA replication protein DnaC